MLPKNPPKIYFKHVYGSDVNEWGCVGFPTNGSASDAAGKLRKDDVVLLAITNNPKYVSKLRPGLKGRIFAVCQLLRQHIPTAEIANPQLMIRHPVAAKIWKESLPLARLWDLDEPKNYQDFGMGEIASIASARRGHMIDIEESPTLQDEIRSWYDTIKGAEQECFRSGPAAIYQNLKAHHYTESIQGPAPL